MTSVWTEAHAPLLVAGLVGGTVCWIAAGLHGLAGSAVVGTVAAVGLVSLLADTFFGLAIGLAGAAVTAYVITTTSPQRDLAHASLHAATVLLVLLFGALCGGIGDSIRRSHRRAARVAAGAVAPVPGSLGLLSADDAHARLEEEIIRAQIHDRPLALAVVTVTPHDDSLSPENLRRARRAVGRVLDTQLRATDIPFVGDQEGELGVIMVETEASTANDVLESALILARDTTFADRETGKRRYVGEVALVLLGVAEIRGTAATSHAFLDASRDELTELAAWSRAA